jgi:sulfite reductase (NADPH) flavoprotein alpha-component
MTTTLTSPAPAPLTTSIPVIPESAPFTPAQRAWLNGFFAGLLSRGAVPSSSPAPTQVVEPMAAHDDEDAMPWHDPALPMEERLALAEGKPPARRLMAAMAQLDCGACGYRCRTYADAIASGEEKDLTRCAPGGRETAKKLKELAAIVPADQVTVRGAPVATPAPTPAPTAAPKGPDRRHPFAARLLKNQPLNAPSSSKDTRHIVLDLHGSGLTYKAGDALGVLPENCPDLVGWILEALDASGAEAVTAPDAGGTTLHVALVRHVGITQPSTSLVQLLANCATNPEHTAALRTMLADDGPGIPEGYEILDLLQRFPSARPAPEQFVAALKPLRPRLYSISSSPAAHADEVHLTVAVVRYVNALNRQCKGVASTYLAERLRTGQKAKVFVHGSHGFAPPADANVPMIMVGPGTGVAPFRAFLQERAATAGSRGRNWLFFGDQRRDHDFLYRDEIERYLLDGVLTRLDTAFSRDQPDKIYVQHRMLERGREIWAWLQDGAHFYVCGDAQRMAKDVDAALKQIVAEQGGMSADAAAAYIGDLAKSKRYARDVY